MKGVTRSIGVGVRYAVFTVSVLVAGSVLGDARAAWPPPPGSEPSDPENLPDDYADRWAFGSNLPEQPNLSKIDLALGASGMRVDAAWTYGIGNPNGIVAVLDTGIDWTATDLRKRIFLNAGELVGDARPRSASGQSCGGGGDLAGYDCDGDGRLSIADYDLDPRLTAAVAGEPCFVDRARTVPGPDRKAGDVNRNCVLDPGDLARFFADGVDDDANGYRDDIAGWDAFEGDNDPESSESTSGTARALEVAAEGNNGEAEVGVCPDCRVLPVRVSSSAFATGASIGEAIAFSVEAKAKVALVGVELLAASSFVRAASADAARGGTALVLQTGRSLGRVRSQASLLPGALVVGSVRYDKQTPAQSTTFVASDACQGFGPAIDVVASADGCNVQGAARAAGVLALLATTLPRSGNASDIRPGELVSLVRSTASRTDLDPERTRSLRTGAGRIDAFGALEEGAKGVFPPEIQIDAPAPFEWLDAQDRGASVPIVGRVSARHARGFDVRLEWAAGENPKESEFRELSSSLSGLSTETVAGANDVPLATIDLRQIEFAHPPDPEARGIEESLSVTLRIRATAHYASGDVASEVRRVVTVHRQRDGEDDGRLPGFPLHLGAPAASGPVVADLDGDGQDDVVVAAADGRVHAYSLRSGSPLPLAGFPFSLRLVDALADDALDPSIASHAASPAYRRIDREGARETPVASPLVADVDGDGKNELVFASREGTLYVVDRDGRAVPPWPRRLPRVPRCTATTIVDCADIEQPLERGIASSPFVFDFDGDGRLELLAAGRDGRIHGYHADGRSFPGFPVAAFPRPSAPLGALLVVVPDDGSPRLVVATEATPSRRPSVVSVRPGATGSTKLAEAEGSDAGAAALAASRTGDVFVAFGFGGAARISLATGRAFSWPSRLFGSRSTAVAPDELVLAPGAELAVADVDGDAALDLAVPVVSRRSALLRNGAVSTVRIQEAVAVLSGATGASLYGAPFLMEAAPVRGGAALGDVSGDGSPEAITGGATGVVHAVDGCGREAAGFPKVIGEAASGTPALGTFGASGKGVAVLVATANGSLFGWKTAGDSRVLPWPMARGDARGSGAASAQAPNGSPLDCRTQTEAIAPALSAGGCRMSAASEGRSGAFTVVFVGGVATLLRRRREKRILRADLPK